MTVATSCQPVSQLPARECVELTLSQLDRLPTLPAVVARLLAVTTSDESSARDVVEIVESDAALTAAILRLVRCAESGVRGEALTVAQAVTLLGFTAVRNAVLSIQLFEAFANPEQDDRAAVTRKGLWQHSLAVACTAEMIGERVGGARTKGEAFVCGLLHDIGKVALDACWPKSYARVVDHVERRGACICDVEREIFGLDHTVAGKRLVARWGLAQAIVECVWLHHQSPDTLPGTVGFGNLVCIVHLADNLVRQERIGYSGYQHVCDVHELAGQLGMDPAGLAGLVERIPKRMAPFRELIDLDDHTSHTAYTASLATANRRLGRLNSKLVEINRRLDVRSACMAALQDFAKTLSEADRVGDVCVAAAKSIRRMLGADCALAFFGDASSGCSHTGYAQMPDQDPPASGMDRAGAQGTVAFEMMPLLPPRSTSGELVAAPKSCEDLWERCVRAPLRGPLWMLPLQTGGAATGAVLVAVSDDAARRFRSMPAECTALSTTMGLAISSAKARVESEHMTEELVDLNRRLRAAQKGLVRSRSISMIAAMAAGAAHELNNPLSIISGRAQMELARCDDEESARTLNTVIEQTQRATQIVTDLMSFAKPEPPKPVLQSLRRVLEPLCQHWRASSSLHQDQVTFSVANEDATVYADPGQLDEILSPVIANALEAAKPETTRVHINSPSNASDETVRIVVEDNGAGMTRNVLEHAIDPFFSSRPAGRGRGLGLSQAYRLAEVNGGRLWLESTPNVGTTVTIELPARGPIS